MNFNKQNFKFQISASNFQISKLISGSLYEISEREWPLASGLINEIITGKIICSYVVFSVLIIYLIIYLITQFVNSMVSWPILRQTSDMLVHAKTLSDATAA